MWLRPPDDGDVVYEFFAPFAHVEGRYEWCRVRSPTHGVFDLFIILGAGTGEPATVYHASEAGARFLAERYPECAAHRADELRLDERDGGRTVIGLMRSGAGPVREGAMRFDGQPGAPRQVPYGGTGQPVWGGRFTCWGVDLVLDARATGIVEHREGTRERIAGAGLVTLGSFGRIAPRALAVAP